MTIDWTTLGASVITLTGVLLTLLFTGRREDHKARREHDWANASWAREKRVSAHMEVLRVHRQLWHSVIMRHRVGGTDAVAQGTGPIPQWIEPLGAALLPVRVFGSVETVAAADHLFLTTLEAERDGAPLGHITRMNDALESYRRAVQADLGLPVMHLEDEQRANASWQERQAPFDCGHPSCPGGHVGWGDQVPDVGETFVAGPCDTCSTWSLVCPGCGTQSSFEGTSVRCAGCGNQFALVDRGGETAVEARGP